MKMNILLKVAILNLFLIAYSISSELKVKSKTHSNLQLRLSALEKEYDNDIDSFNDIEGSLNNENDLIEIKDEKNENTNSNINFLEVNKNEGPFGQIKILNRNLLDDKKSNTNYSFEKKTEESELKAKNEKKISIENKTANILQSKKTFNASIKEKITGSFKKFKSIPRNTSDDFMLFLNYLGNASKRAVEKAASVSNLLKKGHEYETKTTS